MKILLICNQGVSTGMLVDNMKQYAAVDDVIEAIPASKASALVKDYDVVLVGPQIRYKFNDICKVTRTYHIPAEMVDMQAYGMMDGKRVFEQAKQLYESRGEC